MVKVIGVHQLKIHRNVYLIELEIPNCDGMFDLIEITQGDPSQPRSNWQVPYLEHILNAEGTLILADDLDASRKPELWEGDVRIAFFFHNLEINKPLQTPFGEITLPPVTKLPKRLKIIKYESVD